jgi:hypothetical protein
MKRVTAALTAFLTLGLTAAPAAAADVVAPNMSAQPAGSYRNCSWSSNGFEGGSDRAYGYWGVYCKGAEMRATIDFKGSNDGPVKTAYGPWTNYGATVARYGSGVTVGTDFEYASLPVAE